MKGYLNRYKTKGYFILREYLRDESIPDFEKLCCPEVEEHYESDGVSLRSLYGLNRNPYFNEWLTNQKWIPELFESILGSDFYLHQSKVNIKNNQEGSSWPFHRDFPFWNVFDFIPRNDMVNIVVYLDDVVEGSGEIKIIPGSHREFLTREKENAYIDYSLEGSASNDLLFGFSKKECLYFEEKYGVESTYGAKGSVLVFSPDIIHGSGMSLLDLSRRLLILTFNSCANLPAKLSKRPEYLCSTDSKPIIWN